MNHRVLFRDCNSLLKICAHPFAVSLKDDPVETNGADDTKEYSDNSTEFIIKKCPQDCFNSIEMSNKMHLLFDLLEHCKGGVQKKLEKLVVFSQSLVTLDAIEHFLRLDSIKGNWVKNEDYFRIDGKVSVKDRDIFLKSFNNADKIRARCVY